MSRMLVVYYSWSNGNTKRIAEQLAKEKHADLARIETVIPYPKDYNTTVDQGQREVEQGVEPQIRPLEKNVADYDVIAVGTPTWWYTMAPAVRTFLKENDFSGKTVIPFMTNGGWPGHVIRDMESLCKGAKIEHPFEAQFDSEGGDRMVNRAEEVNAWIESV